MALDHRLGRAQGGEVHALVPADEQREVKADGREQSVVEFGGRDEGCEQVAQGGGSMVNRINAVGGGLGYISTYVNVSGARNRLRVEVPLGRHGRFGQCGDSSLRSE